MRRLSALDYWSMAAWALFGLVLIFVFFGPSPSSWFRPDPETTARSTPVRSTKMLIPSESGECQQTSFDSATSTVTDRREVPCHPRAGTPEGGNILEGGSALGTLRKAFRRE